jgi:hypothetical protein
VRTPTVPQRSDERGIALALALFALVILGALISGAFVVNRFNHATSANAAYANDAQNAADAGLNAMAATWDPYVQSVLPIYDGTPATIWSSGTLTVGGNPLVTYVDSVRRLNNQLFLVEATGRRLGKGGSVVLSQLKTTQLYRLAKPTIGINAAVTVQDPLTLNGNAFSISGMNTLPGDWSPSECAPIDPGNTDDVVGVRSAVGTGVQSQDYDNVFGFPARDAANDPTITDSTFQSYLDYTYATLAGQPGVKILSHDNSPYNQVAPVIDASTTPVSCDKSTTEASPTINLGEPWRNPPNGGAISQCYGYFPVVHGTAPTTAFASGTRGQGTLLIDGDLKLTGGFEWTGLVIIRGSMQVAGTGNKITGAVLAQGVDITTSGAVSGNIQISYSQCAIEKAVGGATLARPLGQRSWMQSY